MGILHALVKLIEGVAATGRQDALRGKESVDVQLTVTGRPMASTSSVATRGGPSGRLIVITCGFAFVGGVAVFAAGVVVSKAPPDRVMSTASSSMTSATALKE